ncbi:cytoskeleton-associated protein 5-like isoform X2 [Homarus americanus]|uniref:cytoskeleton-associated protein 5-like isoform X2 n=1 Tax=Homarus americanus TaxID=6706 RepID=UPI001C45D8AF|nr:cytoskeleton-associated protein 5-like isoform X2 [Homarus americanus]
MEEDTEYLKLPLEDRCVHKLWKARLNGYEECTKYFPKITDERSPEFNKFAPLMKKFVTDSNAVAQEKALDAVLAFVENAHVASRTAGDCTSGVVQKCLAAPKRGTQEKALEIILMYCEIEKYEIVQEELMKGFSQKNPKVVAGCVRALTTALREFGPKVISPKPLMKQVHTLLEDRDKNVREEGKKLVIEMYRWIRQALKPQMSSLKPVQVQELEAEFEKLGGEKVVQTRFLRSQQELKAKIEAQADGDDDEDEEEEEETPQIDPFDLMDPVDILSKLPKDFYEKVEAKKWQERKEAVELLHPLTQNIKLEAGDYHDLMKVLKKMIAKDTNVMIVAQAGHCVAGLARGLKKKFSPFAQLFTETILEKFKEKKVNVVSAMREAIDAVYQTTTLEAIQEIVSTALTNKNPQVKAETTAFLARSLCYCTPAILNKKMLKVITADLLRGLNESDPTVRDNSCEALGVALRVVGEKQMMVSIADVDNLKMQKIREASEKAEIKVKISAPKAKKAAPSKREAHVAEAAASGPRKVVRGGGRRAPSSESAKGKKATAGRGSKGGGGGGGGGRGPPVEECKEAEISIEEALEKATEVLPEDVVNGLTDSNWKARLTAVESFTETVRMMDCSEIPTQALVRVLAQKPGFKDNNFQVLKLRLEALKHLAENSDFTRRSGEVCIQDLVEKLGDPKNGPLCGEVLLAMAEAAKLQWVGPEVMTRAFEQKSPKVQEVALKWLSDAITEFGFVLQPKALISDIKKALGHTNPGVRTAGVSLCGTIYLYMGATLRVFFEDEKAALLQQIDTEFERLNGTSPPAATRGINRDGSTDNDGEDDDVDSGQAVINVQDLVPRTNVSEQLTSTLFSDLADKNWKVRNEALVKVSNIISEAKFIKGDISELPTVLAARMNDMNKNLALEALRITASLAVALGPHCKPHTRNIVPGMLAALGDSKQNIRQQAMSTLNSWVEQAGVKETIDGEVFADALKSGSPFLKAELFLWMAEKLKDAPTKGINKEELHACTQYLFMALEDRNADVRKGANEAVMPFMIHLGYEGMLKHTSRVKPSSKNTVMQALEKAKPNLPAKPQPKQKVSTSGGGPPTRGGAQGGGGACSGGKGTPTGKKTLRAPSATRMGSAAGRKDSEDVDTSPLLQVNNLKQQRASDEQRLRVLRWDFSTPRAEFITQLKDQMTTAGMNRQLVSNMFHQDFKFHIKAIDALNEDLTSNLPACIANLDLILKWLTIRFFDTNPSVIIKAMDYLQQVFQLVSEDEYHLLDTEANGFLPFLVTKFGDPKDSIRGPARNIAKLICNIYPASKVSPYMLEGLKAKNARQRAECLEAIGNLIEVYGMPVCQPSPGVALKEIAKQIADRDNSVRNAALNGLVQVYFREGEKVFKLVGNLSDKDMSLLEERIKRAAKNRPVIKKPPVEPEVPTVRGGGAASGRLNRVIPTPAQPAPAIVRDRESSAGGDQSSLIKRRMHRNPSWSSESMDKSQEDLRLSPPVWRRPPQHNSTAAVSSSISSLSSMSNISSLGSLNSFDNTSSNRGQLKGDWPLPPLHRRPHTSATLEQARRISRSLSFLLGEPDLEPLAEEPPSPHNGPCHTLPPLSPHMPPLLTRTVTSPQFPGLRNQHQSTNPATPFKIDYGLIEKLLENDNTDRPQYNIEEIPDMASILNYKPVCPTPASKLTRPGFSSVPRPLSSASPIESEGAAHAINMVISQVGTPDANTVITALSQLDEVLQSEERCYELAPHIDQLLIVATLQYRLVLNTKMANPNVNKEECIKIYRSLTNCLMMIFNNKQLGTKATRDVLRDVVHVLIHILLDPRLTQLEDGPQIIRAINVLVVRIVEKAQFTHVFSALLKLLHESVSSGGGCKFTELVMKCNWKVIRILPSRTNDLDLDQILFDVHNFLVAYPVNTWSERPSDTPLRTIKTVIHTLCKVYGTTILSHFSKIDNAHGSELHKYLTKALKKPKTEDDGGIGDSNRLAAAQVSNDSAESGKSPKRLSKTAHNTLSEIFRKIGSKENTKEGLIQLYEFKQKHPEADIEPFLRKSSQFFQNYIERGLKRVEMERQAEVKMTSNPASESGSNSGPLASIQVPDTTNFNMNDLVDQFKSIAARAGFDNTYIDTAVKDICSTEKEAKGDISEYIKGLPSEYNVEQTMDRYGSHDQ